MNNISKVLLAAVLVAGVVACKKNNLVADTDIVPPSQSEIILPRAAVTNNNTVVYFIKNSPTDEYKIPVGITTVSNSARTIQFTYTSSTAQNGVHYNAPASITIPAGGVLDTLRIKGVYAAYNGTRIDTVKIKITGGDVPRNQSRDSVTVIMRKYCDVILADLMGNYANTRELWGTSAYGPYTTSISSATPLTATTARIVVQNIYDYGWGPITFTLDFADPANFKATVVEQTSGIADAGTLSAAYAGQQVAVRPFAGKQGTFNQCDQSFNLSMQLGVAGVGWFGNEYTVTMKR